MAGPQHAAFVDARGAAVTGTMLELTATAAGRAGARAGLRSGRRGPRRRRARRPGRGGRHLGRRSRDDGDRAARAEALGLDQRPHPRARPRADRRAGRLLRRRPLSRGAHARAPTRRAARGRSRASCGRAGGSRLRCGGRASATRGSASSSTRSRPSSARRCLPRAPGAVLARRRRDLAGLLAEAGLADVTVRELATPYRAASVEEWWTRTVDLAGPLAERLALLPEPAAQALRARAYASVGPYETADGLEIPGLSLVASATAGLRL